MIIFEKHSCTATCANCGENAEYELFISGSDSGFGFRLCRRCVEELEIKAKWAVKGACRNDGGEWENEI